MFETGTPAETAQGLDIEDYYRRYGPMVLRRCRRLLNDSEKAMDAMQEVFARLLANRNSLKGDYPSSLLWRMATNVCLNMLRHRVNREIPADDELLMRIAHCDEHENRLIAANFLDFIFRREKPSTREIAVMYFIDGMTLEQVAAAVRLSVSGVRKRIRELRSRLKMDVENGLGGLP